MSHKMKTTTTTTKTKKSTMIQLSAVGLPIEMAAVRT